MSNNLNVLKCGLTVLVTLTWITLSAWAAEPLTVQVDFSVDGGKTWSPDTPSLSQSAKLKVRVGWQFADPADAESGFRMVKLVCTSGDFASANNGYHGSWKPKGWYQKSDLMFPGTESVILDVDLGARADGVLGDDNQWMGGKFEDGLLPACEALPPGPHCFQVQLNYVDRGRDRRVTLAREFTLPIADASGVVPKTLPKSPPQRRNRAVRRRPTSPVPAPELMRAGATLFVDIAHPQADDDNDGTSPDRPLKTVARALELVEHGGTIQIARGTYREGDLLLRKSGTAKFPLTICGAGMDQTFIKGSKQMIGWQAVENRPGLYKVDGVSTNVQQMWADGEVLQQIGLRSAWNTKVLWGDTVCLPPVGKGLADVTAGSFYHDATSSTLYVMLPDGSDPNGRLMEAGRFVDGLLGNGTSHVVLRDLTIMKNNGTGNAVKSRLLSLGEHHWTVENCRIADGEFMGISWNGLNHTLRRSQILRNGNTGIDMSNTDAAHGWRWYENAPEMDAVIEDCLFEGNNSRNFYAAWHAGAMKCIPACRKVTVRRCVFQNNKAAAVWFDHAHGQIVVTDNIFENNRKAVFYEISEAGPGDSFGAFIANNRVIGSVQQGVYLSASCDSFVVNNTFYDNWVNLVLHGMPRKQWRLCDNVVRDNIFGPASKAQLIVFVGDDASNNVVDDNFYIHDEGLTVGLVTGEGYDVNQRSLSAVQAAGLETNGLAGAAMWMDPSKGDFRLKTGSPAAHKGWQQNGTRHSPPPPLAVDSTKVERDSRGGDRPLLYNAEFTDKAPAGGAANWRPESHGIWKQEGQVTYLQLLPGKHINQQSIVNPAWKKVRLAARIRIPEIHPGPTERDAAGFRLRFVDASDKLIQPAPQWMFREMAHDWQEIAKQLDVPPNAARLKMTVAIYCDGQMDVDYIRLEPVENGKVGDE